MKEYYAVIRRWAWTFLFILIMILGARIRLPMTKALTLPQIEDFLHILSSVTAGNASRLTLFSMGLGPYITAMIFWGIIRMLDIDSINNLSNKQSGIIMRLLVLFFAIFQSFTTVIHFSSTIDYEKFSYFSRNEINFLLMLFLIAGAMILSFIADMNVKKGIGKQMLLILPNLLANIPAMLLSGQDNAAFFLQPLVLLLLVISTVIFLYFSLYLYKAENRIAVQQTQMDVNFNASYIPMKILPAGAMPFMFAVTLFSLPQLFLNISNLEGSPFLYYLSQMFSYGTVVGIITYSVILIFLAYAFSQVNVRTFDIAKTMRNSGDYIFQIFPGVETEKYLKRKLNIMIFINSLYLLLVSVLPLIIGLTLPKVTNLAFYFGSIFMVIVMVDMIHEEIKFILAKRHYKIFD